MHYYNIEDNDKQEIVTNIKLEAIIPSIKNNFFLHHMVDFVNRLELSDQNIKLVGLWDMKTISEGYYFI